MYVGAHLAPINYTEQEFNLVEVSSSDSSDRNKIQQIRSCSSQLNKMIKHIYALNSPSRPHDYKLKESMSNLSNL
jgi:hypothetical protein